MDEAGAAPMNVSRRQNARIENARRFMERFITPPLP